MSQSERELEENLIKRLTGLGYEPVNINNSDELKAKYQVTHEITQQGKYKNRYDVTLLINGLPLVQIELKRRGLELKEAFNQINRYYSFNSAFCYIYLFSLHQLFYLC